ncbi:methionine/alanine import family NSS transporter small subunit [Phytoactinopolyspora halotolerans]|uniref:Methionine/alanine import family NSS transporter small subunit n=1 Tax=Phytoactinopolyspora halotolerans TaxID=1981512 RepID=A0A6L9S704_9ACTN|nr:methionine/alanine import family NSS transporter small subunit [Phytoactinopolyspora halotolerans]NEE00328.1 methionine/alanine import family NSS transporter small subunit [Phytoactinopolyspora halotolerans]
MSASAIVMMIVTIAIVWGGLVAGVLYLRNHPDDPTDDDS